MENMLVPCGLDCSACPIRLATLEPDEARKRALRESIAKKLTEVYKTDFTAAQVTGLRRLHGRRLALQRLRRLPHTAVRCGTQAGKLRLLRRRIAARSSISTINSTRIRKPERRSSGMRKSRSADSAPAFHYSLSFYLKMSVLTVLGMSLHLRVPVIHLHADGRERARIRDDDDVFAVGIPERHLAHVRRAALGLDAVRAALDILAEMRQRLELAAGLDFARSRSGSAQARLRSGPRMQQARCGAARIR